MRKIRYSIGIATLAAAVSGGSAQVISPPEIGDAHMRELQQAHLADLKAVGAAISSHSFPYRLPRSIRSTQELTPRLDTYHNTYLEASFVPTFTGSITTTGKSEAIRLDKALFRLHPEFRQKAKVRAQVIAPGHALISVVEEGRPDLQEEDPVVTAFLAFLETDMKTHPKRIAGLSKRAIARATRLIKGVKVTDDERLPEDITC
jgi:antitoxin PrlF